MISDAVSGRKNEGATANYEIAVMAVHPFPTPSTVACLLSFYSEIALLSFTSLSLFFYIYGIPQQKAAVEGMAPAEQIKSCTNIACLGIESRCPYMPR